MRLERWSRLTGLCALGLSLALLPAGCSQHHVPTPSPDAGSEDSGAPDPEQPSEETVVLAPSGAEVEPAVSVMASGQFKMVGSLSVSSGVPSASESYELRSASLELRR